MSSNRFALRGSPRWRREFCAFPTTSSAEERAPARSGAVLTFLKWYGATILVILATALLFSAVARTQPLPQPKTGQCPDGYRSGASYCAPSSSRSPSAVPKVGQCPSNWRQSGNYCVEPRPWK